MKEMNQEEEEFVQEETNEPLLSSISTPISSTQNSPTPHNNGDDIQNDTDNINTSTCNSTSNPSNHEGVNNDHEIDDDTTAPSSLWEEEKFSFHRLMEEQELPILVVATIQNPLPPPSHHCHLPNQDVPPPNLIQVVVNEL